MNMRIAKIITETRKNLEKSAEIMQIFNDDLWFGMMREHRLLDDIKTRTFIYMYFNNVL